MTLAEVEALFERAVRFRRKAGAKAGDSDFSWSVTPTDSESQRYTLAGLKAPEEVEDDVASALVWLWSLKDHVKGLLQANGKSPKWVEVEINADSHMAICADLANRSKHGALKQSRSGKFPLLGKLSYQIPQAAMSELVFKERDVRMAVRDAALVELSMPVLGADGATLGDAFTLMDYSLRMWERIVTRASGAV